MRVHPFWSAVPIQSKSKQKVTHSLDACSPVLVSGPSMLKRGRATHSLDVYPPHVHPFSSVVLICSTGESDLHALCIFIPLVSGPDPLKPEK